MIRTAIRPLPVTRYPPRVAREWRTPMQMLCTAPSSSEARKDYSKTLLLPKTSFPMRANAIQMEPKFRPRCTSQLYEWQQERHEREPRKQWVLHDGPPYANGSPHIGHSMNKILKDMINRYKLLRGYTVNYIPGWDCHGLPIELKAVQESEAKRHKYNDPTSAMIVRKAAKKVASQAIKVQKKHFQDWGVMGDWDRPYLTLQPSYESAQLSVFFDLYRKGFIYQGVRPVHWSPSSNTALAEAELEYPEKYTSLSVFCGFPVPSEQLSDSVRSLLTKHQKNRLRLLIWTTTPWTLPANRGVCVHPSIDYCLVSFGAKKTAESPTGPEDGDLSDVFVIAKSRLEYLQEMCGRPIQVLEDIQASDLIGKTYEGVLPGHSGRVYEADFVSDASGTGLVHTAPGHGQDDFRVITGQYGVEPFCPVDHLGRYTDEVGDLAGLEVLGEGNTKVIEKIQANGMFLHQHHYEHKYPHDWRTKKPIIVRTTKQWFTDLRTLIPDAIRQLESVKIIPDSGQERFVNLLRQRDDWCISRQRCWGVPLPVFLHKETQEPLINEETIDHLRQIVDQRGIDCWWALSVEELLPPSYKDQADQYERCFDTVDVWFDSGVSWNSVIRQRQLPRADLYLEGSDQYRGWFQSSLLTSTGVTGQAPYDRIITHGFVMDGEGRKMSKSIGNVIDPAVIIKGGEGCPTPYGADVLRYWVGSVDYTKDVSISYPHIEALSESKRKIRNTVRFMLSNIHDLDNLLPYEQLKPVDQYMLAEWFQFAEQITEHYEQFNYQKASHAIQQMCIVDCSSFYYEAIKDRLYADCADSLTRRSAQTTLAYSLAIVSKALSPIMCHMCEEIFEAIPSTLRLQLFPQSDEKTFSIFQTGWLDTPMEWNNPTILENWKNLKALKSQVNMHIEQLRRDKVIRQGLEASITFRVNTNTPLGQTLLQTAEDLHLIFNVSSVHIIPDEGVSEPTFEVASVSNRKCERCWLYLVEDSSSNCICPRCVKVLDQA